VDSGDDPGPSITLSESSEVELISFDHDLGYEGDREFTGDQVLHWIEDVVVLRGFETPEMLVQSANPPGDQRVLRHIATIKRRTNETVDRNEQAAGGAVWNLERRGTSH
jgi:hypothetical protein